MTAAGLELATNKSVGTIHLPTATLHVDYVVTNKHRNLQFWGKIGTLSYVSARDSGNFRISTSTNKKYSQPSTLALARHNVYHKPERCTLRELSSHSAHRSLRS